MQFFTIPGNRNAQALAYEASWERASHSEAPTTHLQEITALSDLLTASKHILSGRATTQELGVWT